MTSATVTPAVPPVVPPVAEAPSRPPRRPFATLRAIMSLVLREMATSYGRSPGGYAWAILEPVGGIAVLSIVFSAMFRAPPLGSSFAMFYATGILPFMMFTDVQGKMSQALLYSRPLLAYPTVTYIDALLARFVLNVLTQIMVSFIVLAACIWLFEPMSHPSVPIIIEAFALAALLALGMGTLNCFLSTLFPIYLQIWSIMMRPMFVLAGLMFLYDAVPQPYQGWLWWNPLIHVVGLARKGFYSTYQAEYASSFYVVLFSLIALMIGLVFLRRYHRDLLTL